MESNVKPTSNVWKRDRMLGSGGFGAVHLFTNQETGQKIAVKQCRQTDDVSEGVRSRWFKECKIMLQLNHPNVVKGLILPNELQYLASPNLPVLAMEFCNEGDLRKILNRPESCCGLPEYQVRQIARCTAAAVEYLHSEHIIHRDLKPENIVIASTENDTKIYKLIDLGYAKDLANDSTATSFVGTVQYLAPELFNCTTGGKNYTNTVDYWSLGTTIFECITGLRPFIHSLPPVAWLNVVCRKKPEHIHAYASAANIQNVEYSDKLPHPHQLSSLSQMYFEQWLRMMLLYDPEKRGQKSEKRGQKSGSASNERPYCFEQLDMILNTELIHVYNVLTNEVLASPVSTSDGCPPKTVRVLSTIIQITWHIQLGDQLLLTEQGNVTKPTDSLAKYYTKTETRLNQNTIDLYLFPMNGAKSLVERKYKPLPTQLQIMRDNQEQDHIFADQVDLCKRVIQYCTQQINDLNHLMQAQSVANLFIISQSTELSTNYMNLRRECGDVITLVDFCAQCTKVDLSELQQGKQSSGLFSQKLHDNWETKQTDINKYSSLIVDVDAIRNQQDDLQISIKKLQQRVSTKGISVGQLQSVLENARKIYEDLRNLPQDQRNTAAATSNIVVCVEDCERETLKILSDIDNNLRQAISVKFDVDNLRQNIEHIFVKLYAAKKDIRSFQHQRQKDIWNIISKISSTVAKTGPVSLRFEPSTEQSSFRDESVGHQHKLERLIHSLMNDYREGEQALAELDWNFSD